MKKYYEENDRCIFDILKKVVREQGKHRQATAKKHDLVTWGHNIDIAVFVHTARCVL